MAKDDKIALLKEVPLFWSCSDKELKRIAAIADAVERPSGTVLMKEGTRGQEMMVIADGTVEVSRGGTIVGSAGSGEVVGELALLDPGPRTATVTATSDVSLYVVGAGEFSSLLHDVPAVALQILKNVARRLRGLEDEVVH